MTDSHQTHARGRNTQWVDLKITTNLVDICPATLVWNDLVVCCAVLTNQNNTDHDQTPVQDMGKSSDTSRRGLCESSFRRGQRLYDDQHGFDTTVPEMGVVESISNCGPRARACAIRSSTVSRSGCTEMTKEPSWPSRASQRDDGAQLVACNVTDRISARGLSTPNAQRKHVTGS